MGMIILNNTTDVDNFVLPNTDIGKITLLVHICIHLHRHDFLKTTSSWVRY